MEKWHAGLMTCRRQMLWSVTIRRNMSAAAPASSSSPTATSRFLLWLDQTFHDVEPLLNWNATLRKRLVRKKNLFYGYAQRNYGENIAAAYYILNLKGAFRFAGQTEWFRSGPRGRFSYDFMNYPATKIEEIDLSGTPINHNGLDNLVSQVHLRKLTLRGCPEVDGWFLSRLHVFSETLEELDISHCPKVTTGALSALTHLRMLRRLDISELGRVQNPGLVQILTEEMLPHCLVIGADYSHGLVSDDTTQQIESTPGHKTQPVATES
ncbi:distal membrane-arm assembly complex protein 2 isoform X2 [Engraulis encrasicolus]|uniref:distal membrane-arm assembly complex protein 2 isoform X2 n=1 Tax=Engraulis encrasicolus TaxID=184585 RepID=UPI002FD5A99D